MEKTMEQAMVKASSEKNEYDESLSIPDAVRLVIESMPEEKTFTSKDVLTTVIELIGERHNVQERVSAAMHLMVKAKSIRKTGKKANTPTKSGKPYDILVWSGRWNTYNQHAKKKKDVVVTPTNTDAPKKKEFEDGEDGIRNYPGRTYTWEEFGRANNAYINKLRLENELLKKAAEDANLLQEQWKQSGYQHIRDKKALENNICELRDKIVELERLKTTTSGVSDVHVGEIFS